MQLQEKAGGTGEGTLYGMASGKAWWRGAGGLGEATKRFLEGVSSKQDPETPEEWGKCGNGTGMQVPRNKSPILLE